jgi:hypothetical protein
VLILLLLFATGYCSAELVNAKKKTRDDTGSSNNNDRDFDTDNSNNSSVYNNDTFNNVDNVRHFDILCYKDVCLLLVQSPDKGEQDILAIEVKIAYHKGHNRHLKLWVKLLS